MPESLADFDSFWKKETPEAKTMLAFGHTHRRCIHLLSEQKGWFNPGSVSYRRPDDSDKRAHYMVAEDGRLRFGAVSYSRERSLLVTKSYLQKGIMLETNLQDAFFFFGDAPTTRSPLPDR